MNPQAMTLEQIREQGLAVLRKYLGIVGMVRFLQQSEMGWGNYTEERYQWLGDPDLEELAKKIQAHHPGRANLTPGMEPTPSSVRSFVAPASGRGSCLALGPARRLCQERARRARCCIRDEGRSFGAGL